MDLAARKQAMIKPAGGPAFHFISGVREEKSLFPAGNCLLFYFPSPQVLLTLAYEFKLVNGTTVLPGSRLIC
jgi:hypothetical protein